MPEPTVDGSVHAVAERIAEARAAGRLSKPDSPPPEGLVDAPNDDYKPSQNAHTDTDELPDGEPSKVDPELLRKIALGEDAEPAPDAPDTELEADDDQEVAAADTEDEPTDADAEDQAVELAFSSIDELADLVGMDVNEMLSQVKISTVVDGEPGEITLADLRKGHQLESSFTRKNQAFIEQQKAFEKEAEEQRAQIADHFAKSTAVLNAAQQELYSEFNGIDWNALQTSNPAEWNMKRQQFGERQARLNQLMKQTTTQLQEATKQQEQADQEAQARHLEDQHNALMAKVPAWKKDENRRAREGKAIAEYLVTEIGFTPDEIDNLSDHRLILLGRAALGLEGPSKRKLSLAEKKVEKVANLVKPGNSAQRRKQGNAAFTKKAQAAKAELKQTGSTDAAAKAILARKLARAASSKRGRSARV